ncbi:MAG: DUF748 domain-containing protein [Betaproteobacteria bacterium]|nr:MAG: DUF748 domain-containing protein [Betaproteobacteria bacterium]
MTAAGGPVRLAWSVAHSVRKAAAMQTSQSSIAARAGSIARAPRTRKILWWIAGLVAAFAAIGFLVVPPIAKSNLEEALSAALHRKVTVEKVSVNPFVPSATLRGFLVRERQGDAPFASFDELHVNVAWTSIFRLAPVVDEIRLAKPHLRVVRNADRTYNFQDLMDAFLARPKSNAPVPKFALFNLQLNDGQVDFDDQAEKEKHSLTELRIGIPFVSSLPAHREIKVLPELTAKLNGAALGVKGESLPFQDTHVTAVNVNLDAFDLTRLVDYLPFEPGARLRSALLDARLVIAFEQPPGKAPQLTLRGGTAVKQLDLRDAEDRPLLAWQRLGVEIGAIEPLAPRVALKSVELDGVDVRVRRDKSGALNLARIVPSAKSAAAPEPRKATGAPLMALKIERLALKAAKLSFTDQTTTPAFATALEDVQLEAAHLDLAKDKRSEWTLAARSDAGESVKLAAGAVADPPAVDGRLDIAGVKLKRYQPYVNGAADLELDDGQLDLGLAFKWIGGAAQKGQDLKVSDLALTLKSLRARLPGEKQPFARLASLEMKGAAADLAAQTVNLGEIAVRELTASLRREKNGRLNVERIARAGKAGAASAKASGSPWRIELGQLSLERGSLTLEDQAIGGEPVRISVAPLQLKAQKFSTARGQRGTVSLQATINKTGTLAVSGPLALDPLAGTLSVTARSIGFVPLQPYIDDRVNFALTSGAVSAKGTASFAMPPGGALRASYKGDLGVTDFASVDKRLTQDLLKWKTLSLGAIDFNLEPLQVSLDEIALADFYSRIILAADGRLNLQDLVVAPGAAPDAAVEKPQSAAAKPEAPVPVARAKPPAVQPQAALPQNLRIGKITLQGGNVNFSDFFIKPNYTANLTGVGGVVTEMTPQKAGDVELRGKIDHAAPVEILGSVNPLAADLFLDIRASAKDIELPSLSPYAVKYAGYGIARGKLSMNVKYRIENRKLTADNNIYLDQLTLGERVESPTATTLPVTLAVALLKDRNGVIDINLPISGSLDDPQFSLGSIIVKVIVNLIVKAVTAPFALIGSLFGGGEELSYLEFAPGLARLGGSEAGKLRNLAKALIERPGLRLDISGRADPAADREGLKRAAIDRKVKAQKFNELRREGNAPASADAVTVAPGEYEKYLKRAYGEEKFAKPRNVIGFAKDLPVAEMENLMLANTPVTEEDLRLLANARAQTAKEWLVGEGKVPAERIFTVTPRLTAEGIKDKGQPTRADFALK